MKRLERIQAEMVESGAEMADEAVETQRALMRRAEEIRARFADSATSDIVSNFAGWTLVSTGISWGMTDWTRGRRTFGALAFPMALIALGAAVLSGNRVWQHRSAHIGEAEERVLAELRSLDPFARFRVVRDVATETIPLVHNIALRKN